MAEEPPARKPLMSGNWKMNYTHLEAIQVVQKLVARLRDEDYEAVDVSVHPPFTALRSIQTMIEGDNLDIVLGAQNCFWEEEGAYTGEVSPGMLAKLNVRYVIVGHSERREHFGESDEEVNRKAKAVFAAGMVPIMCVGETKDEREAGQAEDKVRSQIQAGLDGLSESQVASMVVAYEPIWAIGTGDTATADDAQSMCELIRRLVGDIHGKETADAIRVQYGGSVKADNANELLTQPDIDGALVGGASLDPDGFAQIVQYRTASS